MINHVSDTSAWVAYYRALESERRDAIFNDPLAKFLVGDRAESFARAHTKINKWTQWTVLMRTHIIDQMIQDLIKGGVKTFINLGAGLDSRPYRMNLGEDIQWIEVDFSHVIEHKKKVLEAHRPHCKLEQIGLDLSDRQERRELLQRLSGKYENIVVLTEGVLPYLTIDQVSELSEDLQSFPHFRYWICEYLSPKSYDVLRNPKQMKSLKNSPFQFFPHDWMGFFETRGWKLKEEKFYVDTSEKLKRATPFPLIFKVVSFIKCKEWARPFRRMTGYLLWERS